MKLLHSLLIITIFISNGLCDVKHDVWGARYEAALEQIPETTTEMLNSMNSNSDNDNPDNHTTILGPGDASDTTTEEATTESVTTTTTQEITTTPVTSAAESSSESTTDTTTEITTTTTTSTTQSLSNENPSSEDNFDIFKLLLRPSTLALSDLAYEPEFPQKKGDDDSAKPNKDSNESSEESDKKEKSRGCDCSSGCGTDENCQGSPCCCAKINFNSINNGGNFTFNADFRKGCNESAGCN